MATTWFRRAGAALLVLVSIVVAVVVIAVSAFHTRWGRDALTAAIEGAVAAKFNVPVSLGAARVTLGGGVELERLAIGDVLVVERAQAAIDVPLAIQGDIRISGLKVRGGRVDIDGLIAALVPSPPSGEPFRLRIEDLAVEDSEVVVADMSFGIRAARGSMSLGDAGVVVDVDAVDAVARIRGETYAVTGAAGVIGNLIVVSGMRVSVGDSVARVHLGILDLSSMRALVLAGVDARATDARRIAAAFAAPSDPLAGWAADAVLPAVIADIGEPISIGIAGRIAGAESSVFAQLTPALQRIAAEVRADRIDPAAVWSTAPAGPVSVDIVARADLGQRDLPAVIAAAAAALDPARARELRSIDVAVTGTVHGKIGELEIAESRVAVAVAKGAVEVEAAADSNRGKGKLVLAARIGGDGAIVVDTLSATARSLDVRIDEGAVGATLDGFEVEAKGPLSDLAVSARVGASGVRAPGASVRAVSAAASAHADIVALARGGDSYPTQGGFSLTARGIRASGQDLRELKASGTFRDLGQVVDVTLRAAGHRYARSLSASAVIDRRGGATRIQLRRAELDAAGDTWAIAPSTITLRADRSIQVSGLKVSSRLGAISADGDTRSDLALDLDGIDLARVAAVLREVAGVEVAMTGKVDADIKIGAGGRRASAKVNVARFTMTGSPPIDMAAEVQLDAGRATMKATLTQPDSGLSVKAEALGRGPVSALDGAAWAALDLRALESATIELADVSLAAIEKLTGKPLPVRGTVGARIALAAGAESLEFTAGVRDLAAEGAPPIDVGLSGKWDRSGLSVAANVDHESARALTAELTTPLPLHSALALRGGDYLRAPVTGKVTIARFDLRRLNRAGLVREPIEGIVEMTVDLGGTVGDPTATITHGLVRQLKIAGATFARVTVNGKADLRSASTRIWASQRRGGLLRFNASYRWGDKPHADIELIASRFDLRFLRALAPEPTHILADAAGTVDARLRLVGPPTAPVGSGMIKLRGGQLLLEGGARRVTGVEFDATLDKDTFKISRLVARSGAGSITASGQANLVGYLPRRFNLTLATDRLPVPAGSVSAEIAARVTLLGRFEGGRINAELSIQSSTVRFKLTSEALYNTGELEDVVYVDAAARKQREAEDKATGGIPRIELRVSARNPIAVIGKEASLQLYPLLVVRVRDGELRSLRGSIRGSQRGHVVLFDRRYRIVLIRIGFEGNPDNPSLDIQLAREFPAGEVRIHVYGTARDPRVSLSSDAGHSQMEVLAIMMGQDPNTQSEESLQNTAVAAGGSLLARQVSSKLPVKIDKIEVHPDGFEVGKYFGDVLFGYRFRSNEVIDKNHHEGTVEWNFFRRWVVDGRFGDQNIGNADLLYILRW